MLHDEFRKQHATNLATCILIHLQHVLFAKTVLMLTVDHLLNLGEKNILFILQRFTLFLYEFANGTEFIIISPKHTSLIINKIYIYL